MSIVLTIIYPEDLGPEQVREVVFGHRERYIGRSHDNSWLLHDPHKFVGRRHGKVGYREGEGYFFIDHSSNGTYLRKAGAIEEDFFDNEERLLETGDVLCLGEYEIKVEVYDDERTFSQAQDFDITGRQPELDSPISTDFPDPLAGSDPTPSPDPGLGGGMPDVASDSGDFSDFPFPPTDLDPSDLPEPEPAEDPVASPEPQQQPEPPPRKPKPRGARRSPEPTPLADPVTPKPDIFPADQPNAVQDSALLDAFFEGLGLDFEDFGNHFSEEDALALGTALRESVLGSIKLLEVRKRFKFSFGLEVTRVRTNKSTNPLKQIQIPEIALETVLKHRPGFMNLPEAIKEAFEDSEAHLLAMGGAIQNSLSNTLETMEKKISPDAINRYLAEEKRTMLKTDSKRWRAFLENYETLELDELLSEELKEAYLQQVENIRGGVF